MGISNLSRLLVNQLLGTYDEKNLTVKLTIQLKSSVNGCDTRTNCINLLQVSLSIQVCVGFCHFYQKHFTKFAP